MHDPMQSIRTSSKEQLKIGKYLEEYLRAENILRFAISPTILLIFKATWSIWCLQDKLLSIKIPRYFT